MPFAYLKDPLFLACFVGYWAHRWSAAHDCSSPLLRSYWNDLICIPFLVPIMLWLERRLGLRKHDHPPQAAEILIPLLVIGVMFEIVIPNHPEWHVPTVADPMDMLAYCAGALAASIFWRFWYSAGAAR